MESTQTTVIVSHGNAVMPYTVVERQTFNTEFAARLFGYLTCLQRGQYYHWTI